MEEKAIIDEVRDYIAKCPYLKEYSELNIDNSKFFENFRSWLEENNKKKQFPNVKGIYKVEALTNGYIFATNANEAIYRIQCKLEYFRRG